MATAPPNLPGMPGASANDSPLDRALALMLADEREAALRWSAAVVEQDGRGTERAHLDVPPARGLRTHGSRDEGLSLGSKRAIDSGNLPLAVAAIADLRMLGVSVEEDVDADRRGFLRRLVTLDGGSAPATSAAELQQVPAALARS